MSSSKYVESICYKTEISAANIKKDQFNTYYIDIWTICNVMEFDFFETFYTQGHLRWVVWEKKNFTPIGLQQFEKFGSKVEKIAIFTRKISFFP